MSLEKSLHRDDEFSKEDWAEMISGLRNHHAVYKATNWISHGMRLTKGRDGILCQRKDYAKHHGSDLFITNDGQQLYIPRNHDELLK